MYYEWLLMHLTWLCLRLFGVKITKETKEEVVIFSPAYGLQPDGSALTNASIKSTRVALSKAKKMNLKMLVLSSAFDEREKNLKLELLKGTSDIGWIIGIENTYQEISALRQYLSHDTNLVVVAEAYHITRVIMLIWAEFPEVKIIPVPFTTHMNVFKGPKIKTWTNHWSVWRFYSNRIFFATFMLILVKHALIKMGVGKCFGMEKK